MIRENGIEFLAGHIDLPVFLCGGLGSRTRSKGSLVKNPIVCYHSKQQLVKLEVDKTNDKGGCGYEKSMLGIGADPYSMYALWL